MYEEHVALGADMGVYQWAGMALPWTYRSTLAEEQRAVRERAGLADVSQLQVVRVSGPGAVACLEHLLPRRIDDMAPGTSRFSVLLSRFGRILDEALILRFGPEEFWVTHGCGAAATQLSKCAGDARIEPLASLHALAVQGPHSLDVLARLCDAPLDELPPFAHLRTRVSGRPCVLSRTGFTGARGYELFCEAADAVPLWRAILGAGAPEALLPYGYAAIDLLRIEAGFALYPADLGMAASIWDAGLGWLVKGKSAAFIGREAVERARGTEKHRIVGIRHPGEASMPRGAVVQQDGCDIGVVTSSAYSPATDETLCVARILRDAQGVRLLPHAYPVRSGAGPSNLWKSIGVQPDFPFVRLYC